MIRPPSRFFRDFIWDGHPGPNPMAAIVGDLRRQLRRLRAGQSRLRRDLDGFKRDLDKEEEKSGTTN